LPSLLNLWDESIKKRYYADWIAEWEAWRQRQADLQDDEKRQWWATYTAYLQTPEWFAKRQVVFHRANGVCEGCRRLPAVHVHHLTYERVGDELLFDLVAVCRACHQKAHPNKAI
jgi:5-methylcytosine-specific restriction endonuclease McrA